MKSTTLKLIAGILLIFLGTCHQGVHLLFELDPDKPQIVFDMMNYKIEMMGTHSLMKFHSGFSIMTGHFLMSLGLILILLRKKLSDKSIDYAITGILLFIFIISVLYFHALAYGVSGLATLIYFLDSVKKETI
jgi:hypothetical protein